MELKMEGLTKHYGSKVALDHLSFTMTKGVYGLLGPNGAGKSTMMNILAGNLRPTSGRVYWNSTDVQELGKKYRAVLGFMPQQQALYPEFRGREFLYYMAALEQMPRGLVQKRVETVLSLVGLTSAGDARIRTYSGGMKQRLLLAQAILAEPKLLILDEPTAGLDPRQRIYVRRILSDIGKDSIVLIATHVVSDVEKVAKEIMMIGDGKLLESGSPEELTAKIAVQAKDPMISSLEDVYLHCYGDDVFEHDLL